MRAEQKFLCCEFLMLTPFVDGVFGGPDRFGDGQRGISGPKAVMKCGLIFRWTQRRRHCL
jgi:hypothetical protein